MPRKTYREKYNSNHGYITSRKVLKGKYKGHIIVLYDNRDGIACGNDAGKYVFVNETLSLIGFSACSIKSAYIDLRHLASGVSDYEF